MSGNADNMGGGGGSGSGHRDSSSQNAPAGHHASGSNAPPVSTHGSSQVAAQPSENPQETMKLLRQYYRPIKALDERKPSYDDLKTFKWGAKYHCERHPRVRDYQSIESLPPLPASDTERNVYAKWDMNRWVQFPEPYDEPVFITHCNYGGGNCFFCAIAHVIYGSDIYWPYVKAQLLVWHKKVLEDPNHPRHLLYKAIEQDTDDPRRTNASVLNRKDAWTLASNMGQVVADLYDIFLVIFDFDETDNSNFPKKPTERGPTSSKVSTYGCSNASHKFIGFSDNTHYEPLLPFVARPSEYRFPTENLPTSHMFRRKLGSVAPEQLIPRPVPQHTDEALEIVLGIPPRPPRQPSGSGKRSRDDDDDGDDGPTKKQKLEMAAQQTALDDRATQLENLSRQLAGRQATLNASESAFAARSAASDQMGTFQAQRSAQLASQEAALADREAALIQRESVLAEREAAVASAEEKKKGKKGKKGGAGGHGAGGEKKKSSRPKNLGEGLDMNNIMSSRLRQRK